MVETLSTNTIFTQAARDRLLKQSTSLVSKIIGKFDSLEEEKEEA